MLRDQVLNLIENLELDEPLERDIILEADYVKDKVFDSIMFVLLIVALEDEFNIEIDDENLLIENLSTFDRIVELVENLLKEKSSE